MKCNYYATGLGGFIGRNLSKHIDVQRYQSNKEGEYVVIHLSAYGNHYYQDNIGDIIQANILDLLKMVSECDERLVKFYNISTSSVTLPKQTMYSASKLFGETFIDALNDERFVNVRPYSVYGPGEADHRFIPTVIRHLHSGEEMLLDTKARHDWIHVDDFIKAMLAGYTSVGTGVNYSNLEIVEMLEIISGKKLNYKESRLRSYDNYSWRSPVSVPHRHIYEGLKNTYESFTR